MPRILNIASTPSTDQGTFGSASIDALKFVSLELPWRDNQPNLSCIPAGTYTAWRVYSGRFVRDVYQLQNVPDRSAIEIHPANWAGDVEQGWYSDLQGCICLGLYRSTLVAPNGRMQSAISQSTVALDKLMAYCMDDSLTVVISRSAS